MQKELKFFDDIEKLRGFACLLIFIQHIYWICPYPFLQSLVPQFLAVGSGAVHIFFAISGFVITYSLHDKLDGLNENFLNNLKNFQSWLTQFFKRRFFRLFPVVLVVLASCGIFLSLTETNSDWALPLLRCPFEIIFGIFNNSVGQFVEKNIVYFSGIGPLWTLAVESQFYIFWPFVLLLCKNNNQRAIISLFLGMIFCLIITPISNLYLGDEYYWTSNNISELFLGSFLAFLYKNNFQIQFSKVGAKLVAIFSAFAVWFYPSPFLGETKIFYANIIVTFSSVLLVMLCAFCEKSFSFPGFDKIFKYLGRRSFSFYAIQLTLANVVMRFTNSVYFPKENLSKSDFYLYQFLIFFVLLMFVTELLYRFIEEPCRKLGRKE